MVVAAGLTDVNFALSFWTALTFLILLVVLGKFAWGPILQMLETRERAIAEAIESAKRERAAAEAASAEMQATLEKARAEAAELLRRDQQEVAAAKAELMAQAKWASSWRRMRSSISRVPLSPALRQASIPSLNRFTASYST